MHESLSLYNKLELKVRRKLILLEASSVCTVSSTFRPVSVSKGRLVTKLRCTLGTQSVLCQHRNIDTTVKQCSVQPHTTRTNRFLLLQYFLYLEAVIAVRRERERKAPHFYHHLIRNQGSSWTRG